jgi:hypothetical protein
VRRGLQPHKGRGIRGEYFGGDASHKLAPRVVAKTDLHQEIVSALENIAPGDALAWPDSRHFEWP